MRKIGEYANHAAEHDQPCEVSIVIPFFEEEGNVGPLFARLKEVLAQLPASTEVIAVNDGSRDHTLTRLREGLDLIPRLSILDLRRNSGQTAAIMAGFDHAKGDIVVTLDGDQQNDPGDIPLLIETLHSGYDVVVGWRKNRQDAKIRRNFVSRVANSIISRVSKVPLRDYGCTLKAYRKDVIGGVRLYGEMHRFIPIYASWQGAKVTEVAVRHHPRVSGRSKYGLERIVKVVLDLIVVYFLDRYLAKPIYVFGGFGLLSVGAGFASFLLMLIFKFALRISMISTPLPVFTAMCLLVGTMSILLGLLAEVVVRTYFESQGRAPYGVRRLYRAEQNSQDLAG